MRGMKRMATKDLLQKRSRRSARAAAAKVLTKGQDKGSLSVAHKNSVEKRLGQSGWQQRLKVLNKRLMPQKRRDEISRKR